jgi:hypothetical protein
VVAVPLLVVGVVFAARAIEQFPESRGQHARGREEPDERARKLTGQKRQRSGCPLATDFVRTELSQASLRFGA